MLVDLHWLPIYYRVIFNLRLLTYKALNGLAPCYLSDLLSYRSFCYSIRSIYLLQINFLLNIELSLPLMVFGAFHSLLQDFGIGYLQIFVLAPQLLVLKADSKRSSLHYFLIIGNLISYFIFLFNHFCFYRLI